MNPGTQLVRVQLCTVSVATPLAFWILATQTDQPTSNLTTARLIMPSASSLETYQTPLSSRYASAGTIF